MITQNGSGVNSTVRLTKKRFPVDSSLGDVTILFLHFDPDGFPSAVTGGEQCGSAARERVEDRLPFLRGFLDESHDELARLFGQVFTVGHLHRIFADHVAVAGRHLRTSILFHVGDEFVLVPPCVAIYRRSLVPDQRADALPLAVSDAVEDRVALPVAEHIGHALRGEAVEDFPQQSPEVMFQYGQIAEALACLASYRVVSGGQEVGRISHHAIHFPFQGRKDFAAVPMIQRHSVITEERRTRRGRTTDASG